jgi:sigma54-dependent transcription regulator
MPYYYNKSGKLTYTPELPTAGESQYTQAKGLQEQKEDQETWGSGALRRYLTRQGYQSQFDIERERGAASRDVAGTQAASAQNVAEIQAAATIAAARARRGYAQGGAVKNDHPFNKSFDNKLLMKGRR